MAIADLVLFDRIRIIVEGAPILLLPPVPEVEELPPLRIADDGSVEWCDGWRVAARLAMTIVDGPGENGIPIQGHDGSGVNADEVMAWCEAADEHGGAVVLAFEGWNAETTPDELLDLALRCSARGGAMRHVPYGDAEPAACR